MITVTLDNETEFEFIVPVRAAEQRAGLLYWLGEVGLAGAWTPTIMEVMVHQSPRDWSLRPSDVARLALAAEAEAARRHTEDLSPSPRRWTDVRLESLDGPTTLVWESESHHLRATIDSHGGRFLVRGTGEKTDRAPHRVAGLRAAIEGPFTRERLLGPGAEGYFAMVDEEPSYLCVECVRGSQVLIPHEMGRLEFRDSWAVPQPILNPPDAQVCSICERQLRDVYVEDYNRARYGSVTG